MFSNGVSEYLNSFDIGADEISGREDAAVNMTLGGKVNDGIDVFHRGGDMLSVADILDVLAIDLIGIVPEDESILISTNRGLPVALNSSNGSRAGQAFHNVARRLDGSEVPFLDLTPKSGFLNRLRGWVRAS